MGKFNIKTPWKYDTSHEKNISATVFTAGRGSLFFKNVNTGAKMEVGYYFVSVGANLDSWSANVSISKATYKSWGYHIYAINPTAFGPSFFPCRGHILSIGASTSSFGIPAVMASPTATTGKNGELIMFGLYPSAAFFTFGTMQTFLPSAGVAVAECFFYLK